MAIWGSLLTTVILQVLKLVTPTLRSELDGFVKAWAEKAFATPNKWDDVGAKIVAGLLSVDLSGVTVVPSSGNEIADAVSESLLEVATGKSPFDPPGNELGGA